MAEVPTLLNGTSAANGASAASLERESKARLGAASTARETPPALPTRSAGNVTAGPRVASADGVVRRADPAKLFSKEPSEVLESFRNRLRQGLERPPDFDRITADMRARLAIEAQRDPVIEVAELERRTAAGDADSAFSLGLHLAYGIGISTDRVRASELLQRAADAGNARALAELGRLALADTLDPTAPARAENLFRESWSKGEAEGAVLLASGLRLGLVAARPDDDTQALLVAAADRGNHSAQVMLYEFSQVGETQGLELPRLLAWLESAASAGETGAPAWLASYYWKRGDFEAALPWYEKAALAGNPRAVLALVFCADKTMHQREVLEKATAILERQLARPEAADPETRITFAMVLMWQARNADDRARVLEQIHLAAGENNNRARLIVELMRNGVSLPEAFVAEGPLKDNEVYERLVQLNANTSVPIVLKATQPDYPSELSTTHVEGLVVVEFLVDPEGKVRDLRVVSSPHPALSAAAEEAVQQWQFRPGMRDGKAVTTRMSLPVQFVERK